MESGISDSDACPTTEAGADRLSRPESLDPSGEDVSFSRSPKTESNAEVESNAGVLIPATGVDLTPPAIPHKPYPDQPLYIPVKRRLTSAERKALDTKKSESDLQHQHQTKSNKDHRKRRRKHKRGPSVDLGSPLVSRKSHPDQLLYIPVKRRLSGATEKSSIAEEDSERVNRGSPAVPRKSYPDQPLYIPVKRRLSNADGRASDTKRRSKSDSQHQHGNKPENDKLKQCRVYHRGPLAGDRMSAGPRASQYKKPSRTSWPQPNQAVNVRQTTDVSTVTAESSSKTKHVEKAKDSLEQFRDELELWRVNKRKSKKAKSKSKHANFLASSGKEAESPTASATSNQARSKRCLPHRSVREASAKQSTEQLLASPSLNSARMTKPTIRPAAELFRYRS